jgi:hypothetical protein
MVLKTGPLVRGVRREHGKGIRAVALVLAVMLSGFFCLSAWAPETDAEKGRAGDSSGITPGASEEYTPGVLEQEMAPAKAAKNKRFPWFFVAAGVVAAGVIIYFTVIKKPEYKLNVSVGTGVSGSPKAGMSVQKKGKKVNYSYMLVAGYKNLEVMIDGAAAPASGEIRMDRDHTLTAFAQESYYSLTVTSSTGVNGTPAAGAYTHKEGTSVTYGFSAMEGYANVKVTIDEIQVAASGTVLMDRDHILAAVAEQSPPADFDVRGKWRLNDYDLPEMVLSGNRRAGQVYRPDSPDSIGEYTVTKDQIEFSGYFDDHHFSEYSGKIRNDNHMDGNYTTDPCDHCDGGAGTWRAVRIQ